MKQHRCRGALSTQCGIRRREGGADQSIQQEGATFDMLSSIPDDVIPDMLASMGNHSRSYKSGVRLSATNTFFRRCGARLPCNHDRACCLLLNDLIPITTEQTTYDVFNVTERRVERVCCDPSILLFRFDHKPISSARWLNSDRRLVWSKQWKNVHVRLSLCDVDLIADATAISFLVNKPLDSFAINPSLLRETSAPEILTLSGSRRSQNQSPTDALQSLVDRIASDLVKPINMHLRQLSIVNDTPRSATLAKAHHLVAQHLTHLTLNLFPSRICKEDVPLIVSSAERLHRLDLSGSVSVDAAICLYLNRLLQCWRQKPEVVKVRRLVLDQVFTNEHYLLLGLLIHGASMPHSPGWDAVNASEYITIGDSQIYLSCSGVCPRVWEAAHHAVLIGQIHPEMTSPVLIRGEPVRLAGLVARAIAEYRKDGRQFVEKDFSQLLLTTTVTPPQDKQAKLAKVASCSNQGQTVQSTSHSAEEAAIASSYGKRHDGMRAHESTTPQATKMISDLRASATYTNAERERDRYMIQWFDYPCKNCGTLWVKNSVTISFRQTAVSECLKGKRECSSRPEYQRMISGERFITDRHMPGNNGTDLTPPSALIQRSERAGFLVAIRPGFKFAEFFRPHPIKPPPAKVEAWMDGRRVNEDDL